MEATWRQKEPNDITVYKQRGGLKAFVTACLAPFTSEALNLLLIFPGMNLNRGKSLITRSAETETPGEPGEALPSDLPAHGGCLVIFKIQYLTFRSIKERGETHLCCSLGAVCRRPYSGDKDEDEEKCESWVVAVLVVCLPFFISSALYLHCPGATLRHNCCRFPYLTPPPPSLSRPLPLSLSLLLVACSIGHWNLFFLPFRLFVLS